MTEPKKRKGDHVVLDLRVGGVFLCRHCGANYRPTLPAPLNVFIAAIKAFARDHRGCKPR